MSYVGYVYMIKCLSNPFLMYIGSTKNFYSRVHSHCTHIRKGKDSKLYNMIRENGGIGNFDFQILKRYDNVDSFELRKYENEFIELLEPCLNSRSSFCSDERKKEQSRLRRQKFNIRNPDYDKKYYRKRKEKKKQELEQQ